MRGRAGARSIDRKRGYFGILIAGLVIGLLSIAAVAANYVDEFATSPWGNFDPVASFTTGTVAAGLSYTASPGGDGCDFDYADGNQFIDITSTIAYGPATETFTIVSRDGKSFVFNSVHLDVAGDGITITASGPEPFTIFASGIGTFAPSGGSKLVTEVTFSSTNFYDYFDKINVELVPPWMDVQGNETTIVNGDATPSVGDHTDLGSTAIGTPASSTFTLRSIGEASLDLTNPSSDYVTLSSNPSGDFLVSAQPTTDPIATGGSDVFTIQCNPTGVGVRTATVSIASNAASSPYEFSVQCSGSDSTPPTVSSIVRQNPTDEFTNANTVAFLVTFDENVQNVSEDGSDFALSGAASGSVNSVTTFTADTVYDVEITGVSGDGELDLDIKSGNDIQDVAGNPLGNAPPVGSEQTYTIDNVVPADPTVGSTSHDPSEWSNEDMVVISWSGASDTGSGVAAYSYEWSTAAGTVPDTTQDTAHAADPHTTTSVALADGDSHYFHLRTADVAGNWTSTVHVGPFYIDTTPPSAPTGLSPASGTFTNDLSPTLSWDAADDNIGGSGMRTDNTYRVVITDDPITWPTPYVKSYYTAGTTYEPELEEGEFAWRIYARDNVGNVSAWSAEPTLTIDTTAPNDPTPSSTSHTVGVVSNDTTVDISVAGASDPLSNGVSSGIDGFDHAWDQSSTWTATEVKDVEETWSGDAFTAASDGDWYFHVATVDNAGNWTATEHVGPFPIDTVHPHVDDVTADTDPVYEGDATQFVTVTFNEAMRDDGSANPSIIFSAGTWTSLGDGAYDGADRVWTETFSLTDNDEEIADVTVDVSGAKDAAGNDQEDYTPEAEFDIDTDKPDVTINQAGTQADPTNESAVGFVVVFDEPVIGFATGDVTVGGTAGPTIGTVTETAPYNGTTYNVVVGGMSADGTVTAAVGAGVTQDAAGNTSNASTSTDDSVTIDTTAPNDPTPSSTSHTVGVVSNDTTVDISVAGASDPLSNGVSSGIDGFDHAWDQSSTWTATEVKDVEETWSGDAFTAASDGDWYFHVATVDNAGNWTATEHVGPFPIDTVHPHVDDVTADTDPVYEGDATQFVTVTFNEAMRDDGSANPSIIFSAGTWTSLGDGAYDGADRVWTETFSLTDNNEEIADVTVDVSGAKDAAGNDQEDYAPEAEFDIDMLQPSVSSLTENPSMIVEANEGDQTFTLTIVYDEPMNAGVAPTLGFPAVDPTGTITLDTGIGGSGWSNSTTYVARYDVTDANAEIDLIDVRVTGAQDLAGNTQVQYDEADVFSIDTVKPSATSVTVGTNPVYEGDLTQQVTVTCSEPMDAATIPSIVFSHGTWTEDVGSRIWASFGTVFTVTYTLTDLDEESYDRTIDVDVVTVDVIGGKDAAGNDQEDYAPEAEFDIDTLQPTVIDATSTSPDGCYTTGADIDVTLTFSEEVRTHPFGFPDFLRLVLNSGGARASTYHVGVDDFSIAWWVDTVSRTYTVASDENSCDLTLLGYSAIIPDGLFDWAGNVIDYAGPPAGSNIADHKEIVVDTVKPTATVTTDHATIAASSPIYEGSLTLTVTVTYNEPMNLATTPTITLENAGNCWGAQTNLGWSGGDTVFKATFTHDGTEEEILGLAFARVSDASGATDVAGNVAVGGDSGMFDIDTRKPEAPPVVGTVTADTNPVYEGDLTQFVTVTFDEAMRDDGTADPVISFSHGAIWTSAGDGAYDGTDWIWTETFVLTDADEEFYDRTFGVDVVTVDVSGAKDAAGNDQEDYAPEAEFDIDTLQPTLIDATSSSPDGCYTAGADIDVTLTFSEEVRTIPFFIPDFLRLVLDSGGARAATYHVGIDDGLLLLWTTTVSGTYTVASDENSCDLTLLSYSAMVPDGLFDWAGNVIDYAGPSAGPNIADQKEIVVDTTDPTIAWIQGFPSGTQEMDGDCSLTFPIEVQVTDNFFVDAAAVDITLGCPVDVGATHALTAEQVSDTRVDITGTVTVSNLTGCPATVDLDIDAEDCAGNASGSSDSVTVSDVSAPTFTWITDLPDTPQSMDDDCSLTFPIELLVEDNCCIGAADVTVKLSNPPDVTVADTVIKTQEGANVVRIEGDVTLSDLTDGSATVTIDVVAQDSCGSSSATSDAVTVADDAPPTISGFAVTPDDGLVDANCEEVVSVYAVVRDNCCIEAGNVTVAPTATNAVLKNNTITATQNGSNEVIVSGTIVVHSLAGCPATIEVEVDATDCGGNNNVWTEEAAIEDEIIPVIHDLAVEQHALVDDCCEATVAFDGYVEDNCCIHPDGITIAVMNPTDNATVAFTQATDAVLTQNGPNRVELSGEIAVSCITSCPAIVQVTVNADDCCGNSAVEVSSTADETDSRETGHVVDEIAPIPRDDPRQDVGTDESAILDPLVRVGVDKRGTYRLLVREGAPVSLNVAANDSDNCSCVSHELCDACSECDAVLRIYDILDLPGGGTAVILDGERTSRGDATSIRYAPARGFTGSDQFTYRIVDACGNVSSGATVYVEVVARSAVEDPYLTTCAETSVEFDVTATDPWMDPEDPGFVPFEFSIVTPPTHGVVSGDLTGIVYTTAGGTTDDPASATIVLTYTPAAGFVGQDRMTVQCVDPFGDSAEAAIDVAVVDCITEEEEPPSIAVGQGVVLRMILPPSFRSVLEGAWGSVLLVSLGDGLVYPGVLSAMWDESAGQYVLLVDTEGLAPGEYRLLIPLGSGETVELTIEVGAAE